MTLDICNERMGGFLPYYAYFAMFPNGCIGISGVQLCKTKEFT